MKSFLQGWMTVGCLLMSSAALAQTPKLLLPVPSAEPRRLELRPDRPDADQVGTESQPTPSLVPLPKDMRESAATSSNSAGAPADASFEAELQQLRQEIAASKLLREEFEKRNTEDSNNNLTTSEQRRQLTELLSKLAVRGLAKKTPPVPVPDPPTPETTTTPPAISKTNSKSAATAQSHPLITDKIVDPFALGRTLFRSGDYVGAEQAFRKVKPADDNRTLLRYLIANCLRKQSRWEEAAKAYRIVAESNDDPALQDLAKWQLDNIRWNQKTEAQLEQLRQRREGTNPGQPTPQKDSE